MGGALVEEGFKMERLGTEVGGAEDVPMGGACTPVVVVVVGVVKGWLEWVWSDKGLW